MVWYKELGFNNNPFSIKPGAFNAEIVGYDLSEIINKIDEAKVLFIEGEYGFGKTSILKHIISRFGGQKKVAYYNCNRADESINTHGILKGSRGFLARLVGGMPSDLILLLDEVERISQNDQKDLLKHYKDGSIKSIVFLGPDFDKVSFSIDFRKLMVNNVIKLTELTDNEAVQLVRERVGALKLLDDRIIKLVFKHSSNNPRLMLENLEDVVRYAVDNNEEQVTDDHLKEVLGVEVKSAKPAKAEAPKKKEQREAKPAEPKPRPKPQKKEPDKPKDEPKPRQAKPKEARPKQEKPKEVKPAAPKPSPKPQKKEGPKPKEQPKPKEAKPKEARPKQEKPKQAKSEDPKKKDREHPPKEPPEEEFEDRKSKKKSPDASAEFDEEADYSEPAEEEPADDDKGGEYYYYY